MGKYVAPTHHYGDITAMVKRDSVECDGGLALNEVKNMLIVSLENDTGCTYSIWNTATDRLLGHDLNKSEAIEIISNCIGYDELSAEDMVDHPKPYTQILRHIIDKERKFYKSRMRELRLRCHDSARDSFDAGNYGILHIVTADELKHC